MKAKRSLSFILIAAVIFSLIQSFPLLSSAEVNGTGCVEADWEDYLKTKLPMDSSLRTYGEHVKIYAVDNKPLPENERFYVYKIHTSIGNSASFVPQRLEMLIEDSYRSVMSEEIDVTILEGYETAAEKYRGIGDGQAVSGDYLLQIQRGVDSCEVAVEIVVHKNLSLTTAGEAKWNSFLENPRWYNDSEFSRYLTLWRKTVTDENGVEHYTYSLSTSFDSIELFTEERMYYQFSYNGAGCGKILSGYKEAYEKLSKMPQGGSVTENYELLIDGEYVARIPITVSVSDNFSFGNFFWEEVLNAMPTTPGSEPYAEHAIISSDNGQVLEEPIVTHKLHITLGHAENVTEESIAWIISHTFDQYAYHIAPPRIQMISGFEETMERYQQIGDGQAVSGIFRFVYTYRPRHLPSYNQNFEYGIEAEIVLHKDLTIDNAPATSLSSRWDEYLQEWLPCCEDSRVYGEEALIEAVDNQPLAPQDRFYVYKIHTSFGKSANFTKENLETLLEESYAEIMESHVDISVINGFEAAKNQFALEGYYNSITTVFTLKIRSGGSSIVRDVEIVIHKDPGLEMVLPNSWKSYSQKVAFLHVTLGENGSFTRQRLEKELLSSYKAKMNDRLTAISFDGRFEQAFAAFKNLEDGKSRTFTFPITITRNNNTYSVKMRFTVEKDLSGCTGYDKGVCPACGAKLGDVNNDGVVDDKDALLLRQYLAGVIDETGLDISLADMNQDGSVDAKDQLRLRRLIAGESVWD